MGVGGVVEDPRLAEGGDHKLPGRRPLEGVEDRRDVLGQNLSPLSPGTLSLLLVVENVVERLIELLQTHCVGVLVPNEILHASENQQIERLCEVGRMGDQKHHRDVFGQE